MLETTLATTFAPGSNLKGDVTGANWSFLLPTLELNRIVCIGVPLPSTLAVLSRIGKSVLVVARDARELKRISLLPQPPGGLNVLPIRADWETGLPLAGGAADLVFVADRCAAAQVERGGAVLKNLRCLLRPEGLIYLECRGLSAGLLRRRARTQAAEPANSRQVYWLTPQIGEAQTAVPATDPETTAHFLCRGLFSLTCNPETVRRFQPGRSGEAETILPAERPRRDAKTAWQRSLNAVQRLGRRITQNLLSGSAQALGTVEDYLARKRFFERIAPRHGVLLGSDEAGVESTPPRYLVSLAKSCNVDIANHRWGLCAKGEYSSRKVLVFLFDGLDREPQYIVKMTREPRFNSRLENECRALSWLERRGLAAQGATPRVAFFGHHGGIAIVGETAVTGDPFRKRTTWDDNCPYARSAINWLTHLAESTADTGETTSLETAEVLHSLLRRFVQIYRPSWRHYDFLYDQIERIADSGDRLPTVFQHGDPGTWNVMASDSDQAVFLDWEAAEQYGMPLWDLFYFLRSYCVGAARNRGVRDSLRACAQHLLGSSPFSALVVRSTLEYSSRCGLPNDLVEPLFYTCWMHRALKEANRLDRAKLNSGRYVSLLRLCIDERNAPTLRRLFSGGPKWEATAASCSPVNQT